jgi:4-amino-4-deoxy-L-arabinose transferase-like glycosyltransferase
MAGIILAFYLLKDSFQIVSSLKLENRERSSQIIYSEIGKNKLILIIFASILFFFSPYTIFSAISLHTEAIFTLFLILIFYFFPKIVNKPSFKNLIIFGLISGLTLQTRITGILVLVFFVFVFVI